MFSLGDECERHNPLDSIKLSPGLTSSQGGALCRPIPRHSQRLCTVMRRSDPACASQTRPQGRQAGSLTPRVLVPMSVQRERTLVRKPRSCARRFVLLMFGCPLRQDSCRLLCLNERGEEATDEVTRPFSLVYKQKMLNRLTGKDAVSARQLSLETGLRQQTLSRWLQDASSLSVMPAKRPMTTYQLFTARSRQVEHLLVGSEHRSRAATLCSLI